MGLRVSDRASGSGCAQRGVLGCPSGPSEGVEGRGPGRELGREVRKGEEEVAGWAGREGVGRAGWVVFLLFFPSSFLFLNTTQTI